MKKIISYILLIFWLCLIFYLSNQTGSVSGMASNKIIYDALDFIYNIFSFDKSNLINVVNIIEIPLRECMHAFEYLILALLFINLFRLYNIKRNSLVFILCLVYAITDEIHQLFVPGRAFQYFDIFMDSIGSIIGIFIYNIIKKRLQ